MERSLTVIVPVQNAAATLTGTVCEILDVLPELTRRFDVVIVDDGSTDATSEVAQELALNYPQVRVVYRGNPAGREAAIRTGLEQSRGEVVLVRDEGWGTPLYGLHKLWRAIAGHVAGSPSARKINVPRGLQNLAWSGRRQPGFRLLRREAVASEAERSETPGPARPNFLLRRQQEELRT